LKPFFFSLAIVLLATHCMGQKEYNHWMLASKTRLDFKSGTPAISTYNYPAIPNNPESSVSISDTGGKLLFYTFEGRDIYNRNHAVMANGSGIASHTSVQQGELIIPHPLKNKTYFLITHAYPYYGRVTGAADSVYYHVVDMNANSGLGAVTRKNVRLNPRLAFDERSTATWHYDRKRVWLLQHDYSTDEFYAFMVDNNGIDTTPVISHAGTPTNGQLAGEMCVSRNGCYLAQTIRGAIGGGGHVEVLAFDNKTGKVGATIFKDTTWAVWGTEFSDDGSRLYITHNTYLGVYQYDMTAGSAAAIAASRTLVSSLDFASYRICLGPDNKIYVATFNAGPGPKVYQLALINQPRLLGTACGFNPNAFPALTSNTLDLPNNWNFTYRGPNCDGKFPPEDTVKHTDTLVIDIQDGGHTTVSHVQPGTNYVVPPDDTTKHPVDTTDTTGPKSLGVPTAFSPDGNGVNDVLYVRGAGIEDLRFSIYNRWGQLLFESSSLSRGWDGTYKGTPQDSDVYVYLVRARFKDGTVSEQRGNVSIVR
jgi:gliding motility-associated-like protein